MLMLIIVLIGFIVFGIKNPADPVPEATNTLMHTSEPTVLTEEGTPTQVLQEDTVEITIFATENSFTIYVGSANSISLEEIGRAHV